jgi:peptidoglycan-N-acetylglucosamine deacetylase
VLRNLCVCLVLAAVLTGCAKPPQSAPNLTAYSQQSDAIVTSSIADLQHRSAAPDQPLPPVLNGSLAGRTLTVASNEQLVLRPREVVLTFDDGPRPGKTETILDTLDRFGVKATFLMLGQAVERNPELARVVAQRGHTVGSHTFDHTDLTTLAHSAALAEMQRGHETIARALAGSGHLPSRFFRFPYLAQTGVIRTGAIDRHLIILDVDIDSKDYYKDSSRVVMERTLARLDAQGQGIILFHDIHARTVSMLPDFLEQLQARGYKVVTLRSSGGSAFDTPLVTAGADGLSTAL